MLLARNVEVISPCLVEVVGACFCVQVYGWFNCLSYGKREWLQINMNDVEEVKHNQEYFVWVKQYSSIMQIERSKKETNNLN